MTTYLEDRERESFAKLKNVVLGLELQRPLIFDVGANVGQSISIFKKSFPQSVIHSFEPNPDMFSLLEEKWGGDNDIALYPYALNSKSGIFPFHVTNVPEASSLLPPDPKLIKLSVDKKYNSRIIDVECATLDTFCFKNKISSIDLLKLDVQGAELEVLKGAKDLLQKEKISVLYVEAGFAEAYTGQMEFKDLMIFCSEYGFQLWDISPFLYTRTGRLWWANTLFLNKAACQKMENTNYAR